MEKIDWTKSQKQRLRELNAEQYEQTLFFPDLSERDTAFFAIESRLTTRHRRDLKERQNKVRQSLLFELESRLVDFLCSQGFVQVFQDVVATSYALPNNPNRSVPPLGSQGNVIDDLQKAFKCGI